MSKRSESQRTENIKIFWDLKPVEGKTTIDSDYVVAQCPKCGEYLRQYVDRCNGLDNEYRTRVFGAHIMGGTANSRICTLLTYARQIVLPPYCSECGTRLHSASEESEEDTDD